MAQCQLGLRCVTLFIEPCQSSLFKFLFGIKVFKIKLFFAFWFGRLDDLGSVAADSGNRGCSREVHKQHFRLFVPLKVLLEGREREEVRNHMFPLASAIASIF